MAERSAARTRTDAPIIFEGRASYPNLWSAPAPDIGPAEAASDTDPTEGSDTRYVIEHYAELVARYPMSWIAVRDATVVAHGATQNAARQRARAARSTDAAPPLHLYFVPRAADHITEH